MEQELCNAVKQEASCAGGQIAFLIKDMQREIMISENESEVFPAASLIKLPILYCLFEMAKKGSIDLEQRVVVEKSNYAGGFGVIKDLKPGLKLTYKDLAVLMITLSDNVATNILIDQLGIDRINKTIAALSMTETRLERKMMDAKAKEEGFDNFTSAGDMMKILEAISRSQYSEEMLEILFNQQCNNKLPFLMGKDIRLAHKTGDLPGVEHDAGILFIEARQILIVVLTKNLEDNLKGVQSLQRIGRQIYDYYKERN